jgi:hypothetical protein
MPDAEEIQRNLTGAWRLMTGRVDGLRMLDTSVEGFWDSFFAIVVAAPALAVGWLASANDFQQLDMHASRLSIVGRLAMIDMAAWLLPIAALAIVARQVGIADRFVPYVVSGNWASALLVWLMLPPSILHLLAPGAADATSLLSLGLFLAAQVLLWRQTNAALAKGPVVATAVFVGMFACALTVLIVLQAWLGLEYPAQLPG